MGGGGNISVNNLKRGTHKLCIPPLKWITLLSRPIGITILVMTFLKSDKNPTEFSLYLILVTGAAPMTQ